MENNEEVLDQLHALAIDQRKVLKSQRQLVELHGSLREELRLDVEALRAWQREVSDCLARLGTGQLKLVAALDASAAEQEEIWLTREAVIEMLCIGVRTFYRRRKTDGWVVRKSGRQEYYLKSSVLR
ncbi:hypothetical protein [Pedobacter deserti]|uniref:hypothetical protein n=1 Tax=Pedobacter deserti TaxID=2817382 RepID=UPI00210EE959|nr:hypothetical protein [Pedobacter sp. SYSU D00382]